MSAAVETKSIVIAVPPSAQSLDVSGPLDAFLEANRQSGGIACYDIRLVATSADRIIKADGMSLIADASIYDRHSSPMRRSASSAIGDLVRSNSSKNFRRA
jgi:transcriptional regulator GlxA family with amidase domain